MKNGRVVEDEKTYLRLRFENGIIQKNLCKRWWVINKCNATALYGVYGLNAFIQNKMDDRRISLLASESISRTDEYLLNNAVWDINCQIKETTNIYQLERITDIVDFEVISYEQKDAWLGRIKPTTYAEVSVGDTVVDGKAFPWIVQSKEGNIYTFSSCINLGTDRNIVVLKKNPTELAYLVV